jgi:hypothetical protein
MAQGQQRSMADANANERHESLRHALEDDCRANKHLLCPRDDDDCVARACIVVVGDFDNAFAAELVATETPETSCRHRCCPVPNYEELSPYRTSSCCDVLKNSSRRKGESRLSRRSLIQTPMRLVSGQKAVFGIAQRTGILAWGRWASKSVCPGRVSSVGIW